MVAWLGAIGSIIFLDLVLSGDNALVIGIAASRLPKNQRLLAIAIGGGGAIILRILFATLATFLLQLPLLGIIGGVGLLFIAVRLLVDRSKDQKKSAETNYDGDSRSSKDSYVSESFISSIMTIFVADLATSLDNVLAVGALASGNLLFLLAGLFLSIVFLLASSALITEIVGRLPWLLDVACIVIAWTASNLFLTDHILYDLMKRFSWMKVVIPVISLTIVSLTDLFLLRRFWRKRLLPEQ